MTAKDAQTLRLEVMALRRDFEACRQHSCERTDHITALIEAYRAEVAGLGQTAAAIARETKAELTESIMMLRRDVATLMTLLGDKEHA